MSDRRYDDEETAAIFLTAAENPQAAPPHAPRNEGLTLADLQDIGREVGIPPEAVALAAQSLELRRQAVTRSFLGLPIGVERTVALNRWLTDAARLSEPEARSSPTGPCVSGPMGTSRLSWSRLRTDTASGSEP